jgi:diacylglycerol kinase family enzyme
MECASDTQSPTRIQLPPVHVPLRFLVPRSDIHDRKPAEHHCETHRTRVGRGESGYGIVFLVIIALVLVGVAISAVVEWRSRLRRQAPVSAREISVRSSRPVLIVNPWSGDGKAESLGLASVAEESGINTVVLQKGDDLRELARDAVADGCDLLMMAGGDGSLAVVAEIALEYDVRFACVPVGTRNHFAMDLGLDRSAPLKALDAAIDGVEIRVGVGRVGGRLFLNNVSFGLYAEAISDPEYRDHRTSSITSAARTMGNDREAGQDLTIEALNGDIVSDIGMLLVSNNPYEYVGAPDFGARPSMDTGQLGVIVAHVVEGSGPFHVTHRNLTTWSAPQLLVSSGSGSAKAGVDGELYTFETPLSLDCVETLRVVVPKTLVEPAGGSSAGSMSGPGLEHLSGGSAPGFDSEIDT